MGLPCSEIISMCLAITAQYRSMTDKQTDNNSSINTAQCMARYVRQKVPTGNSEQWTQWDLPWQINGLAVCVLFT